MFLDLLRQIGFFGIAASAIAWLMRSLITNVLNKDIAQFKARLQHDNAIEMERLRGDLRILSIEHEIRFRSIHERQADALAGTYARLYEVQRAVGSYVSIIERSDEPSKADKLKIVGDAYEEFRSFFFPRRIFLPPMTAEAVRRTADKLAEITNVFTQGQRREQQRHRAHPQHDEDYWTKAYELLKHEVPPLLAQLEADFQRLLGVTNLGTSNGDIKQR